MKTVLRWIALLPGCILAMLIVNIINGHSVGWIFPQTVDEICKAWFGSLAFVMAAHYIAPRGKFITSLVVATAYCSIGVFSVALTLHAGHASHPIWLEIVTTVITVIASVFACFFSYAFEKDKNDNLVKESTESHGA